MSIDKWKFRLTLLFLSVFLLVYNEASSLAATSSKFTQSNNPFRSLLSEKNNSVSLPQSLSKSVSTKKQNPALRKKKGTEKATLSNSTAQLPKLKTSSRTDISSQTKQITETLSLKDILETSAGRYAFIDEKSIVYRPGMRMAGKSFCQDYL
jgi:hypothetical protein